MASKLAVAGVIEGNLTDEGLAAMSDCQDMTTALARELTNGIEGEVEDLGAVFKRMALLKPAADIESAIESIDDAAHNKDAIVGHVVGDDSVAEDDIDAGGRALNDVNADDTIMGNITARKKPAALVSVTPNADAVSQNIKKRSTQKPSTQSSGLLSLLHAPKPSRAAKKKPSQADENQLTLFDMLNTSA